MLNVNFCPECNVPEPFNQGQAWLNNGDIVQKVNPNARIAFIECENLDPVFRNIGDIIGVSIEHLVMNIASRVNVIYLEGLIPPQVKEMIHAKQMDPNIMVRSLTTLAQISGYGKYEWLGYRYENSDSDYAKERVTAPHSLLLSAGGFGGAVAASLGGEHAVSYEEISPGVYEYTVRPTQYPEVLKEKLNLVGYEHKDGDIELERCACCGGPRVLSDYRWLLDKGFILSKHTGMRMAMLGPAMMDPIFNALEAELGEDLPKVVVEAQRRHVITGFYPSDILESEDELRMHFALKGLGNLKSLKMGQDKVLMRLENACLHLLVVGLVQGIFELTREVDSHVEWELSEAGDLELEVTSA